MKFHLQLKFPLNSLPNMMVENQGHRHKLLVLVKQNVKTLKLSKTLKNWKKLEKTLKL